MSEIIAKDTWKNFIASESEIAQAKVGHDGKELTIDVKKRIPFTDIVGLINASVYGCVEIDDEYKDKDIELKDIILYGTVHPEFFEAVFRSCVFQYYTNVDIGDCTIEEAWELVGNDEVYSCVASCIWDNVYWMQDIAETMLSNIGNYQNVFAEKFLRIIVGIKDLIPDTVLDDVTKLLDELKDMDLDELMKSIETKE